MKISKLLFISFLLLGFGDTQAQSSLNSSGADFNSSNGSISLTVGQIINNPNSSMHQIFKGCTQDWADNFNPNATDNDGSCERLGCILLWADNYDSLANIDDGSCDLVGCISSWADNYVPLATTDDGTCYKEGCSSDWADNYDVFATIDDGSCERLGCMASWADNYDVYATIDDNSCALFGCMSDWADNYDSAATSDDGLCVRLGCQLDWADNYDSLATVDDGSCDRLGCMVDSAFNYDPFAITESGLCYPFILGCTIDSADNYFAPVGNPFVDVNTSCSECCLFTGCMEEEADNYLAIANLQGPCEYLGCMDPTACNFDAVHNIDTDPSLCVYPDSLYDCNGVCLLDGDQDGVCDELEQYGCTDALAYNYDPLATSDNASCYYELQVELVVNNPSCKGGLGSVDLTITGGLEPIEVNTFGLDLSAIPPGNGYVIYVSDASGNDYLFGGLEYNFTSPFNITEPEEQLQLVVDYNDQDNQVYFSTNSDAPSYTWYYNNVADESISATSFSAFENGLYGVEITDENGCSLYSEVMVESVSIEELTLESLEIYPNPAGEWVHVNYDVPKNTSSIIRIISLTGKLLYKMELEAQDRIEKSIPLSDFSAGLYLVEIEIDAQKLYRRLSIK